MTIHGAGGDAPFFSSDMEVPDFDPAVSARVGIGWTWPGDGASADGFDVGTVVAPSPPWRELNAFILQVDPTTPSTVSGLMAGITVGLKDVFDVAGLPTTCGSSVFAGRIAERDSTAWARLRSAGALLAGKTNMPPFSGARSVNALHGPVRNPWDLARDAGGSSSGSAAAVAAGLVPVALGTDTGGSVRIPAACCGVVGLKPTYGLVPVDGVFPMSPSLDHVGAIARSVWLAAAAVDALSGLELRHAAAAGSRARLDGLRVGVPHAWLGDVEPGVDIAFRAALEVLGDLGATIVDVDPPSLDALVEVNKSIAHAEQARIHATLRGLPDYPVGLRAYTDRGRVVTIDEYRQAQLQRRTLSRAMAQALSDVDVLAQPTLPITAPPLASETIPHQGSSIAPGSLFVRANAAQNVTGSPAITVPSGLDASGLPVGLQLTAPAHEDDLVCFVAAAYDSAAGHSSLRPTWVRPTGEEGTVHWPTS